MSHREDRSSEAKRHRSRFDREPSPKRSRRDGKAETERLHPEAESDRYRLERDHKSSRRPRDPLLLETTVRHDSKFEAGMRSKESENQTDRHHGGAKQSSDPARVPRPRSYFEHDDRGSLGKNGRNFNRRTDRERGWWRDPKEAMDKTASNEKDANAKDNNRHDDRVWHHDGYFQMEANNKPPPRRRPAFREQKIPAGEKTEKAGTVETGKPNPQEHESGKRDERGHASRHFDIPERRFAGERDLNKAQDWRGNFASRDRFDPGSRYRSGSDRVNARQGYRPPVGERVEKWKHDLYDEANKSPSPKKDEDQTSKIEALLAS